MSFYNICKEYLIDINKKVKELIDNYNYDNNFGNIDQIINCLSEFEIILVQIKLKNLDRYLLLKYYYLFQKLCEFYIRNEFYKIDNNKYNNVNKYLYLLYISDILRNKIDLTDIYYSLDIYLELYIIDNNNSYYNYSNDDIAHFNIYNNYNHNENNNDRYNDNNNNSYNSSYDDRYNNNNNNNNNDSYDDSYDDKYNKNIAVKFKCFCRQIKETNNILCDRKEECNICYEKKILIKHTCHKTHNICKDCMNNLIIK